jgi:cobalt/nickel transport system permease protein
MHMSDALLSPAVGGALWAGSACLLALSARRVEREPDQRRVPLMGVLGAFVFAAQMVNFSIPGTGSSGHLAGGVLLATLLGPSAGFLVLASVLAVQALFFADGGLLALGANLVNMGFVGCFVAYPLVFRPLAGGRPSGGRLVGASIAAGVASLVLGALGVVGETAASGISTVPIGPFLLLMVPVHAAIGVVEGLATAAVLGVLWRARPGLALPGAPVRSLGSVVAGLAAAALLAGGALSWLASPAPDGLEWSVAHAARQGLAAPARDLHAVLARLQATTALFPDYGLPGREAGRTAGRWPAPDAGTSLAGLAGTVLTLGVVVAGFLGLRALRRRATRRDG